MMLEMLHPVKGLLGNYQFKSYYRPPLRRLQSSVLRNIRKRWQQFNQSSLRRKAVWMVAMLMLLALHWHRRTQPAHTILDTQDDDTCRAVFQLTRRRYRWDSAAELGGCRVRLLPGDELSRRLRLRSAATGQATRLVFIGDSRSRIIHSRIVERFRMKVHQRSSDEPLPGSPANSNLTGSPGKCIEAFHCLVGLRLDDKPSKHRGCSLRSYDEALKMDYWYRPYLTSSFGSKVEELAADCNSRPDTCPSLVVFNTGAWYARRFSITLRATAADWVLRMRRDLAGRRAALRRLAAATSLLWKLEEPVFFREVEGRRPDVESAALMVMQALTYDEASRVPRLNVWSSALPDSGRYERRMCGSWPRRPGEPKHTIARETGDCRDAHHVGRTVLDGQIDTLLDYLTREPVSRSADNQFCCGAT